ncbi:MAG: AEC family transporter [Syntrophobacteraceae bacterium]
MLQVLANTILPIFSIILLGYVLKRRGVIPPAFISPANQLVYYVALPAMLFGTLVKAPFKENFQLTAGMCLLITLAVLMVIALAISRFLKLEHGSRATFVQTSFHGNLGFLAYAIAYYALGPENFPRTLILSTFLMIGQNVLSIWVLTQLGTRKPNREHPWLYLIRQTLHNPVIASMVIGCLFSAVGLELPKALSQGLDILSGLALPMALLLIGASLSFGTLQARMRELALLGALKLVCLPLAGYFLLRWGGVHESLMLPALILLSAPPATVSYVMAAELGGDTRLAAASVSVFTLVSAISYSGLLALMK